MKPEIRIATIGNVDSAKSTTIRTSISTLSTNSNKKSISSRKRASKAKAWVIGKQLTMERFGQRKKGMFTKLYSFFNKIISLLTRM